MRIRDDGTSGQYAIEAGIRDGQPFGVEGRETEFEGASASRLSHCPALAVPDC